MAAAELTLIHPEAAKLTSWAVLREKRGDPEAWTFEEALGRIPVIITEQVPHDVETEEEEWIPPTGTGFLEVGPGDEGWARELGLGEVRKVRRPVAWLVGGEVSGMLVL